MNIASFTQLRPVISVVNLFFWNGLLFYSLCAGSAEEVLFLPLFTPLLQRLISRCMYAWYLLICAVSCFLSLNMLLSQVFVNLRSVDVFVLDFNKFYYWVIIKYCMISLQVWVCSFNWDTCSPAVFPAAQNLVQKHFKKPFLTEMTFSGYSLYYFNESKEC